EIADIVKVTDIPVNLNEFGISKDDLAFLVQAGSEQTRLLNNNKKELSKEDIEQIYLKVIGYEMEKLMRRPIIGITMGDPAGNGPEISVKALAKPETYEECNPLIIGDASCIEEAIQILNLENEIQVNSLQDVKEAQFEFGYIDVLDMNLVDMSKKQFGEVQAMCGEAAFQYVEKAIELALSGEVDGTVTNALNKEAMNLAGHQYSGHTE